MFEHVKIGAIALLLLLAGVVSHGLPHAMGVSTVGAVGMLAAAYLPRSYSLIPVLGTVLIVDAMNGFYAALAMAFVYAAHLAASFAVRSPLVRIRVQSVAIASILSAVVFYLISNITPMAMGFYPNTLAGWAACYVAGLPFLLKGILANAVFGGMAFTVIEWIGARNADRLAAAKRH
ncbi:MAG: DUF6580 family putative transport protein [Pseudomonadota bacterium]